MVSGSSGFIGGEIKTQLGAKGIPRNYLYSGKLDCLLDGADTVIHCAAYGNMSWHDDLEETFDVNVMSTFNLLESCRRVGVKNFIFIGSSSEYGDKSEPMSEEMLPQTKTMYGVTKVCGTYLTRHYSQYMNTVTLRPFSIYGEKEDERRFIPKLIDATLNNNPFTLQEGKHDWVHVDDLIRAIDIVSKCMHLISGAVINVGGGREITNNEVMETVGMIAGKIPQLTVAPKKPTDSTVWCANNGKIRSLGWKQKISLYEGLKRCYDYKLSQTK